MDFPAGIAMEVEKAMAQVYGNSPMEAAEIAQLLSVPPDTAMGDYALPTFRFAKALKAAPPAIAAALAEKISAPYLSRVEAVNGYLNFYLSRATYAREVIGRVLSEGDGYGGSAVGAGKTVCIDYSSINIAKRFHIGHLSTTMIGAALYNLYRFHGYRCVGINHLGDWGTQFGKMIAAYKRWGARETIESGGVDALVELYVRFEKEAALNEELQEEGRMWFRRIEAGDKDALSIFEWFKALTLADAERVYKMLGVTFDSYAGESFYNDKMDRVVAELREKGLLTESQGAFVVDLEAYNMPPCIILKRDGATLYATRDLAAALYRHDTYRFAKSLYVVAYQQDLHFRQVFKVLELMGYDWARDMEHVSFGMVSFEGRALATRKGHVVYLEDLLDKSVEKALEIIREKSPDLENKEEIAQKVGIGAVVFFDLSNNRIKDIDFWWDRALNFDGETGPYAQYTHARCCSVLRKAGEDQAQPDYEALSDPEAQNVVRALEQFPQVVAEAIHRNEPSLVTRHVIDVAQAFNKFYYEHRILGESAPVEAARVALTRAARQVIATGLTLIGVAALEKM